MTTAAALLVLMIAAGSEAQQAPRAGAAPEAAAAERERVIAQADTALQSGRRDEAKRLLASAAERLGSVRMLLRLARIQSGEGDANSALETLRRAREIAPNAEEVLSAIAQVSLSARSPVGAIVALEPLTRLSPAVAQHHYLLGVALMQAGDVPAATDALREAERLEPARPLTLIALGMAFNNRKMFAEAKTALLRSLELDPENVESVASLAEAEEGLGELDAADDHARQALSKVPEHATGNLVAGLILMKRDRYADARAALERAVASQPESPKAYYQLSLACARLGDMPASKRNLELYREKLRAMETRMEQIRSAGIATRGGLLP